MAKEQSVFRFPTYGVTVTLEEGQGHVEGPDAASEEDSAGFLYCVLYFVKRTPHALGKITAQECWDILDALYEDWVNMGEPRG